MQCVDVNFLLYVLCFCTLLVSLQFWEHWQEGREDGKTRNRGPGARQLAERLSLHLEEEHGLHWKHPFLELTVPRIPFCSSVELIKPCRRGTPSALPTTRQNLPPRAPRPPAFASWGSLLIIIPRKSLHIFTLLSHLKARLTPKCLLNQNYHTQNSSTGSEECIINLVHPYSC